MKRLLFLGCSCVLSIINTFGQAEGLYVTEGGKVGVGVDNPAYTLEVGGTGSGSGILISTGDEAFIGWYDRNLKGLANSWGWYAKDGSTFLWDNLNAKEQLTIKNNGSVGIGTASPKAKLDVGSMLAYGELGTVLARSAEGNTTGEGTFLGVRAYNTQPTNCNSFAIEHSFYGVKNNSINFFRGGGMSGGFITINTNDNTERVRINYDGNVAIGTTYTGSYKLNVAGKINCTELHINTTKWADFVFEKDYNLRTLAEVETFISQNQHLPDVPSQAQVADEGISLGEMNAILLQKIEELTLYIIEQEKRITIIEKESIELKKPSDFDKLKK